MELNLAELAVMLDGTVVGDKHATVNNISKIEHASKGDISFISNPKYLPYLCKTNATAIIIDRISSMM